MKNQKLIIVNGPPASGKTNMAEYISRELHIPMFHKDGFKELLSDTMRVVSMQGSRRFDDPSFALLFYISKNLLSNKFSLIIEGNFRPGNDMDEFVKKIKEAGITIVEVFCKAEGELLIERYMKRVAERHAIHMRTIPLSFARQLRHNHISPLNIGKTLEVDTSDFLKIPYKKIIRFIRE